MACPECPISHICDQLIDESYLQMYGRESRHFWASVRENCRTHQIRILVCYVVNDHRYERTDPLRTCIFSSNNPRFSLAIESASLPLSEITRDGLEADQIIRREYPDIDWSR